MKIESIALSTGTVDLRHRRLTTPDGEVTKLTARECALLVYLAEHPSRTISRSELLREVWGYAEDVISRAADHTFSRMRAKLESDPGAPTHFITVHGEGYRFEPAAAPATAVVAPIREARRVRLASCCLDLARHQVIRNDGEIIGLSGTEAALLHALLDQFGEVVRREALLLAGWRRRVDDGSSTLDNAIWRIRSKIEAEPEDPQHLITVRNRGFRLQHSLKPLLSNLPVRVDPFVGRAAALAKLDRMMFEDDARVMVILGPGGIGKTRLAERFSAQRQDRFTGGVWFCDLSEATEGDHIIRALGACMEIPLVQREPRGQLREALRGRGQLLLVLDNVEQVADDITPLLRGWLQGAPAARFLLTSRRRLSLTHTAVVALDPLTTDDACALFEARAQAVRPGFVLNEDTRPVVAEICRDLDHLCLAIELAAARLRVLNPAQLHQRMARRFRLLKGSEDGHGGARHATLWGVIDWSWELLSAPEQRALAQCAVFRGGFDLDAAEAVLALPDGPTSPDVLDVIQALVDQSLLRIQETRTGAVRFSMMQSIIEYAAIQLEGSGTAEEARRRHADYFSAWGVVDRRLVGLDSVKRMSEVDNLRAATEAMLAAGQATLAGRCGLGWVACLQDAGPYHGVFDLLGRVLQLDGLPPALRTRLVRRQSSLLRLCGRVQEALAPAEDALALARGTGDRGQEGSIMELLANLYKVSGDTTRAIESCRAAIAIHRAEDNQIELGTAMGTLARLLVDVGQQARAEEHYRAAIDIHRATGDLLSEGIMTGNLGSNLQRQGRLESALALHQRALACYGQVKGRRGEGITLGNIALICANLGQMEAAVQHHQRALEIHRALGNRRFEGVALGNLGDLKWRIGQDQAAEADLRAAIGLLDGRWPEAVGAFRGSLAVLIAERGEVQAARALLAQGESVLRGNNLIELGMLLCKRCIVERYGGDEVAAQAALVEARDIAETYQVGAQATLAQMLAWVEANPGGRPQDWAPPAPSGAG